MPDASMSNYHRALQVLRDMIVSGELAAGSDHLETELAQRLEMSRTPVREALLTLQTRGLLQVRPRRGVRILPISPEDMGEVYDVVTELECLAVETAAGRGVSRAQLSELSHAIEEMEHALGARDLRRWAEADDRFHLELVRLGGNRRVLSIVNMMQDQVRRARMTTLFMRPEPAQSNADHRIVFEAIAEGQAEAARAHHRVHRQQSKAMLLALLERHQLKSL